MLPSLKRKEFMRKSCEGSFFKATAADQEDLQKGSKENDRRKSLSVRSLSKDNYREPLPRDASITKNFNESNLTLSPTFSDNWSNEKTCLISKSPESIAGSLFVKFENDYSGYKIDDQDQYCIQYIDIKTEINITGSVLNYCELHFIPKCSYPPKLAWEKLKSKIYDLLNIESFLISIHFVISDFKKQSLCNKTVDEANSLFLNWNSPFMFFIVELIYIDKGVPSPDSP